MFRPMSFCAILLLLVLSPVNGLAVELPPKIKVGNLELVQNGAGSREKYFLDLYEAGLYLLHPNNDAAAIINADAPMLIHIVITSKLVSQEKLIASLQEGFKNSTKGKTEPIKNEIEKFGQCFAEEITRGNIFDLLYIPGRGVTVLKNGKKRGVIPGLAFKKALFGIWLGDRPADTNLRQALLGGKSKVERK